MAIKRLRRVHAAGLLVGALATTMTAAPSSLALTAHRLPAQQRAHLAAAVRRGFNETAAPGAIVGVQTPKGKWVNAIGIKNTGSRAPMRPSLHQRIGSVTKTFTGALLMQLVGEHKVSLSDKVSRYVKGVPNGNAMTLREVAEMTSGIASYTFDPAFQAALFSDPERVWRPNEVLDIGLRASPAFGPPGSAFQYSDSNYILLGLVIQQVEAKALGKVLRKGITGPLGLAETSWPGRSPVLPKPRARGYTLQGQPPGEPADTTDWNPSYAWAAGGMISTLHDLLVYGRAMGTGRGLLAPAQQQHRLDSFNPKLPPETPQLSYGIGLVNDLGWIGHTGQVPGYTTAVYYNPHLDATVVVEANSDITSGICPPSLNDDPITRPCATPADRIMGAVAGSLGHPYQLPPLG